MSLDVSNAPHLEPERMSPSIAKLEDSVKLLIELDENYGLHRFEIAAIASRQSGSFARWKPARSSGPIGRRTATHRPQALFKRTVDGVVVFFEIPFTVPEATYPPMKEDAR